jgi:uncharacterized protein (DUF2141 family)
MMRWIRALMALAVATSMMASAPAAAQDGGATVTVKVTGFKGTDGVAVITLYDSEDTWLKIPKAVQVLRQQIKGADMTVTFKGVRPGTYAVSVLHDENKNNEMDMRWFPFPKPKEGAAASNDPPAKMGPPKWEGSKFTVDDKGSTVKATMKYFD